MHKNHQDLRLLPVHYKKVAFGIITLSVLFIVLTISKVITVDKDIVKIISKTGILVSLLLLALTKNKIEDELTSRIRLKAFASSFVFGVAYVIVEPFVSLLFKDGFLSDKGVTEVLITMFLFYFDNITPNVPGVSLTNVPGVSLTNVPGVSPINVPGVSLTNVPHLRVVI